MNWEAVRLKRVDRGLRGAHPRFAEFGGEPDSSLTLCGEVLTLECILGCGAALIVGRVS
jgi:hypothetical protein